MKKKLVEINIRLYKYVYDGKNVIWRKNKWKTLCFVYILKTKIDNALKEIGTYSTSIFLVKYVIKKNRFFAILKVSDPLKEGLSPRSVFNGCFLGSPIFLAHNINIIACKVIWSLN